MTAAGNTLFFQADDSTYGYELNKSDGTSAGTTLVKDIYPGFTGSFPQNLSAVGGKLFFSASDGTHGRESWASDGTSSGTAFVADIRPSTATPTSAPTPL